MKRLSLILVFVLIITVFVGCGKTDDSEHGSSIDSYDSSADVSVTGLSSDSENSEKISETVSLVEAKISEDEALKIAEKHWGYSADVSTEPKMRIAHDKEEDAVSDGVLYYNFNCAALINGTHYSTQDWIYVNSVTGECVFERPE